MIEVEKLKVAAAIFRGEVLCHFVDEYLAAK